MHMASKGHLCFRTYIKYSAHISFAVRPNERDVLDHRRLEYELVEKHGIHVIHQTLADLAVSAFFKPSTLALTIPSASSPRNRPSTYEISTIYSCTPHTPSDFPAPSYYDTHFLLERRRAIKCPSLPLQWRARRLTGERGCEMGCGCPSISLCTTDAR
ncbi:PreATP-grasp domain-containing protein, partial [Rhizopogon salebrosus TDB-379]